MQVNNNELAQALWDISFTEYADVVRQLLNWQAWALDDNLESKGWHVVCGSVEHRCASGADVLVPDYDVDAAEVLEQLIVSMDLVLSGALRLYFIKYAGFSCPIRISKMIGQDAHKFVVRFRDALRVLNAKLSSQAANITSA